MNNNKTSYTAYLLRLWSVIGEEMTCRISLESPRTGERLAFSDLDDLFDFLRQESGLIHNIQKSETIDTCNANPVNLSETTSDGDESHV